MIVVVARHLKEPERWREMRANLKPGQRLGSMLELLKTPGIRRNALCGLVLATAGVVGLWGIGFFGSDLTRKVLDAQFQEQGFAGKKLEGMLTRWQSIYGIMLNAGAFLGIYTFSRFTHRFGRKPAFAVTFVMATLATSLVYWGLGEIGGIWDIFWMVPIMGYFQLALFGGYAIYLPELFPTRLRSTGTSFCYNVSRYLAAFGPYMLGTLSANVYGQHGDVPSLSLCRHDHVLAIFLLGLAALPFAPETKGKPLPD